MQTPKKMYVVYDDKRNGVAISWGTVKEVADYLGMTRNNVYTYAKYKYQYMRRYSIVAFYLKDLED